MIRGVPDLRLGGVSLTLLAVVSGIATVMIVSDGGERTAAQLAALAALRERPAVVAGPRTPPSAAPSRAPKHASASRVSAPAGSTASAQAPAPVSTPTPAATAPASSDSAGTSSAKPSGANGLPRVGHVFELALSTQSYAAAFGRRSAAPYLRSLVSKGTLLSDFQSLGSGELADYLAMVSGQSPNPQTGTGCPTFANFPQGATAGRSGLVPGSGCVYPETALTIGDQVTASGHIWKAYVADMGTQTCAHPNSNAVQSGLLPGTQPGYDMAHNPFIYFHSLLDLGDCATDDEDLGALTHALARRSRTATFSFIAPGLCDDPAAAASSSGPASSTSQTGTSTTSSATSSTPAPTTSTGTASTGTTSTGPTSTGAASTGTTSSGATDSPVCGPGQAVGIAAEDAFLRLWVPRILSSPAYKHNGVLIIAFAAAGLPHLSHPVRTGALVLSRYARAGKRVGHAFGPYSLLRSIEEMLRYTPLAHARAAASFAAAALGQRHS